MQYQNPNLSFASQAMAGNVLPSFFAGSLPPSLYYVPQAGNLSHLLTPEMSSTPKTPQSSQSLELPANLTMQTTKTNPLATQFSHFYSLNPTLAPYNPPSFSQILNTLSITKAIGEIPSYINAFGQFKQRKSRSTNVN